MATGTLKKAYTKYKGYLPWSDTAKQAKKVRKKYEDDDRVVADYVRQKKEAKAKKKREEQKKFDDNKKRNEEMKKTAQEQEQKRIKTEAKNKKKVERDNKKKERKKAKFLKKEKKRYKRASRKLKGELHTKDMQRQNIEASKEEHAKTEAKKRKKATERHNKEMFAKQSQQEADKQKKSDELFAQEMPEIEKKAKEYEKRIADNKARAEKGKEVGDKLLENQQIAETQRLIGEQNEKEKRRSDTKKMIAKGADNVAREKYAEQKKTGQFDAESQARKSKAEQLADEYLAQSKKKAKKGLFGGAPKEEKRDRGTVTATKQVNTQDVKDQLNPQIASTDPNAVAKPPIAEHASQVGQTAQGFDVAGQKVAPPEEQSFGQKALKTAGDVGMGAVGVAGATLGAGYKIGEAGYGAIKSAYGKMKENSEKRNREAQFGESLGEFSSLEELNAKISGVSNPHKSSVTGQSYATQTAKDKGETAHYKRVEQETKKKYKEDFQTSLSEYIADPTSHDPIDMFYKGVLAGETDKVLDQFQELDPDKKSQLENEMYTLAEEFATSGEGMKDIDRFKKLLMIFGKGKGITDSDKMQINVDKELTVNEKGVESYKYYAKVKIGNTIVNMPIDEEDYAIHEKKATKTLKKSGGGGSKGSPFQTKPVKTNP